MSESQQGTEPVAPDDDRKASGPEELGRKSSMRNTIEWIGVIAIAVVLAVLIKMFLIQAFKIPSESMEPTLMPGDRVVVNKLSFRAHDVNRGDVVVFKRPPLAPGGPDSPAQLIKRVIGLPGETLYAKDGKVYVDDKLLVEPYLADEATTVDMDNAVTIPEGQVWVMGDNRTHSADSRYFGPIDAETIIGRAFVKIWPPGRFGSL